MTISIHVPRVEDDRGQRGKNPRRWHFNPRPPCGGRLKEYIMHILSVHISIHVPRVEDDKERSIYIL